MNIDINLIKRRLLVKYPFFGSIVANSKFAENLSIQTAATDGEKIYYNPDFINRLTDEEQTFVFAHEIAHVAFNHIFRSEGKDKKLWNIATDAVINAFLKQDGLSLVEGGVDIPDAINYDAEEMYDILLKEKQNNQNNNQGQISDNQKESQNQNEGNNQNNSQTSSGQNNNEESNDKEQDSGENASEENYDVGHDTHSMWDDAIKRKKEKKEKKSNSSNDKEEKKEEKSSLLDRMFNKDKKDKTEKEEDSNEKQSEEEKHKESEVEKLTTLGEKKFFKQNKIERKKQLEELRKTLAQQSHGAGRESNGDIRQINNIGMSDPLIDWRRLLKEAVKYDIDWSYKNASIEDGVITPYLEEIPQPETEIVLDTSGSIDEALLRNFLRECKNILQTSKVKVGCFDVRFYGWTEIKNICDIDNMTFTGGGGTDFNAAINAFTRRVENKIIFTDGEASMPDTRLDAIWVVFGGRKISPKGGRVIYITEEQLERLCYVEDEVKRYR